MCTLQRLEASGLKLVYTDGSPKWHDVHGYIGGFRIFVENELTLSLYNPPPLPVLGQTNQAAELLAVQTALNTFRHQNIAIITDGDWVFKGATCCARKQRAQGWVSNTGPVSYFQLWDSLLHSIDTHHGILESYHVPSHQHIPGNEKANDLAEGGRLQTPPNFELPFHGPPTPDVVTECTGDTQGCPDPTRRLDFEALPTSAGSPSSDTVSMCSSDDTVADALPPDGESNALHLDSLGLCEMYSPLIHSLLFRLDSDPEPDTLEFRTPPLNALGLEAMPTPQCNGSPNSSVDSGIPHMDFLRLSSPGSAWSCSTDVSNQSRRTRTRIKRQRATPPRERKTTRH